MAEYRKVLTKVGWILIVIGVFDIAYMIYCIVHSISYQSSLNIFTVIAGIFLIKGSLRATRIISFFAVFFFAGGLGILLLLPWFFPLSLLLTYFRLNPFTSITWTVLVLIQLAIMVWVYRMLTLPVVLIAIEERKLNPITFWKKPVFGFWAGACLSVFLCIFLCLFTVLNRSNSEKAKQKIAVQLGSGYKFYVSSLEVSWTNTGKTVHAVVLAYNRNEIKELECEWSE